MEMALVHDIAEGIVGDFTPYCNVTYIFVVNSVHRISLIEKNKHVKKYLHLWARIMATISCKYGWSMNRVKPTRLN